ncbi:SprT family zinc-dependent metalloprotease [Variovorax sp. J22P240]|uniref:M48 family metallopeptidase n=1 Tax=unclassified Variovorax TaxID=663243 RepID=UPI00257851D8|nr:MULTISPECIES: SprT family zinc-dependent metalloprotease [unclassified Variovorax]MDL9999461.1 SprT family zinc-dependent metalloprotease [Variovorax sp. J22P240]MDM0048888.1 SprT family zinc-dependent metalloprotease [Variovorax sp. J22R115]
MRSLLQFTLDLFDAPAAVESPPAVRPAEPRTPPAPGSNLPSISLADALSPASFVHPRASRELMLGPARVAYEFTRGKRRTIGFVVGADGLSVRAPRWVALRDVDAAVLEKSDWILRKLAETQQRHARLEAARIEWKDGVTFPFLGQDVTVRLDPHHAFDGIGAVLDACTEDGPRTLRLAVANNATSAQIRDAAQAWLMRQARRIFIERLDHFAPRLGVKWNKLSLSNASTRWGSASVDGAIRLHWRLVHFRMSVIDYVVAHELSHLRVMDHSARFWETVESVVPDYELLRRQLKDEPVPRW